MRRSTSPRCRTPPSGRIVLRVERGKPTSSGFSDWKTLDLGGFLQKMLHGMSRFRLVEEEGHLPFVEFEVCGVAAPPLLARRVPGPARRQASGAADRLAITRL